ncbi:hypothetical protein ACO2Q8_27335 [Larkinella sp. VNQ87]|uniref:hypothetical protein n=1 Tax=Larkinella sp. VNQ87 TaxID=3400921 RepID=UPI003C0F5681
MKKLFAILVLMGCLSRFNAHSQSCLLSYQNRMDELLPLTTLQKHYKADWSEATLNYKKSSKYPKYDTYEYSWKSGRIRKMTVAGREMNVPDDNRIGLAWIDEINPKYHPDPVKYFRNFYRTATKAEKQQAAALLDKKLKDKGVSSGEQAVSKQVGKTVMGSKGFEPITGVGDAAAWDLTSNQLVVLKGRTTFKVTANVDADLKINQALARKLAAEVLDRCR